MLLSLPLFKPTALKCTPLWHLPIVIFFISLNSSISFYFIKRTAERESHSWPTNNDHLSTTPTLGGHVWLYTLFDILVVRTFTTVPIPGMRILWGQKTERNSNSLETFYETEEKERRKEIFQNRENSFLFIKKESNIKSFSVEN